MSKYTTEVRFICENYAGYDESHDYPINDVIQKALPKVFDFDFPVYDPAYKTVLETKILKHYYTREIGFETVALWKHWLDMRLNEIMPYYNQLYESCTHEFNPFYDVDFTTTGNRNGKYDETHGDNGTSSNVRTDNLHEETQNDSLRTDNLSEATTDTNTRTDNLKEDTSSTTKTDTNATRTDNLAHEDTDTSQNTHYDLYSDTPQGALTGVDNENYLTSARKVTDNGTDKNNGTNTGTVQNEGSQTVTGSGSTANTGTQTNDGSGSKKNTGTQDVAQTGSKDNTGTQTNEGNTTNNGTKNYTNVDDYLEHVAGKRSYATYSAMLKEYRETFINIDTMIINELSDLFMNVW